MVMLYKYDESVDDILNPLLASVHSRLEDVTIATRLVYNQDDILPMIEKGQRILAKTRIMNMRLRAFGMPMVTIEIEGIFWNGASKEIRVALMDRELCHLGTPGEDKADRIVVPSIDYDYILTGFYDVIGRHGKHAIEAIEMAKCQEYLGPLFDQMTISDFLSQDAE